MKTKETIMMRTLYAALGLFALGLAALGAVLPLLPTTPFILLAAYCFARSSKRLHDWLLAHAYFGPIIKNWRASGAIAPRHKAAAAVAMASALGVSIILGVGPAVLAIQSLVLLGAAAFVLSRPNPEPAKRIAVSPRARSSAG